jgi:alpha-tubulin suppressor-like RCC1 family protein
MPDTGEQVFRDADRYLVDSGSYELTDENGIRLNQSNNEYGRSIGSVELSEEQYKKAEFYDLDSVFWGTFQSTVRTAQFVFTGQGGIDTQKKEAVDALSESLDLKYVELEDFIEAFDLPDWTARYNNANSQNPVDQTAIDALIVEHDNFTQEIESKQAEIFALASDMQNAQSENTPDDPDRFGTYLGVGNDFPSKIWCMPGLEFMDTSTNPSSGALNYSVTANTPGGVVNNAYGNRTGGEASPPSGNLQSSAPWPSALSYSDYPAWGSTTDGGANTEALYKIFEYNRENVVDAFYDLKSGWMRFAGFDYGAFPVNHGGGAPFWQSLNYGENWNIPEWVTAEGTLRDSTQLHQNFPNMTRFGEYGPLCVSGGTGVSNKCVSYPQKMNAVARNPKFIDLNRYKVADFLIAEEKDFNAMLGQITERMPGLTNLDTTGENLFWGFGTPTIDGVQVPQQTLDDYDPENPDDSALNLVRQQFRKAYQELGWDIWFEQPDMEYVAYAKKDGDLLQTPFIVPNPPQNLGIATPPSPPINLELFTIPSSPRNLAGGALPSAPRNLKELQSPPSNPSGLQSFVTDMVFEISDINDKTISCNGSVNLDELVVKLNGEVLDKNDYSVDIIPSDLNWSSGNGTYDFQIVVSHTLTPPSKPLTLLANVEAIQKPSPPRTLAVQVATPPVGATVDAPISVTAGLSRRSDLVTESTYYQNPALVKSLYRTFINSADGFRVAGQNFYGTASQGTYSYSFISHQLKIEKFYRENTTWIHPGEYYQKYLWDRPTDDFSFLHRVERGAWVLIYRYETYITMQGRVKTHRIEDRWIPPPANYDPADYPYYNQTTYMKPDVAQLPMSYWTDRNKLDSDEEIDAYSLDRLDSGYYEFGDIVTSNSGGQVRAVTARNPFQNPVTHNLYSSVNDHIIGNTTGFNESTEGSWFGSSLINGDKFDEWKQVISNRHFANENEEVINHNTAFVEDYDWNSNDVLDSVTDIKIYDNTKKFDFNNVTSVACAYYNSYLVNNGELWGIGENRSSQMGSTTANDFYASFIKINTANPVLKVACSRTATMFIDNTNTLYAMGDNRSGTFGIGSVGEHQPITQVATDVKDIVFVDYTAFLLKQDGSVWFSGNNNSGWFDTNTVTGSKTEWTEVLTGVDKISGQMTFLSAMKDNKVLILGSNALGQRGLGHTNDVVGWTEVSIENVVDIGSGYYHTLALTDSGDIYVWGSNSHGQCGTTASSNPISTPLLRVTRQYGASPENSAYINPDLPVQVECGGNSSFYVTEEKTNDGSAGERTLWGMGDNYYGQLASSDTIHSSGNSVLQVHGPIELKKL